MELHVTYVKIKYRPLKPTGQMSGTVGFSSFRIHLSMKVPKANTLLFQTQFHISCFEQASATHANILLKKHKPNNRIP
jgi:hypothetical protein